MALGLGTLDWLAGMRNDAGGELGSLPATVWVVVMNHHGLEVVLILPCGPLSIFELSEVRLSSTCRG